MLNRRSLRIKAMQSIYAFKQCKQSDYNIALDKIKEKFAPDLNAMEKQDMEKLEEYKNKSREVFEQFHDKDTLDLSSNKEQVNEAVKEAITFFRNQTRKDFEFLKKTMVQDAEKISDRYLLILILIIEFADAVRNETENKQSINKIISPDAPKITGNENLVQNKLVAALKNNKALDVLLIKRNIDWSADRDEVRHWFKEIVKKDEQYRVYNTKKDLSFEDDKKFITYLVKNIIFKNESLNLFFEEIDIAWAENKAIIKSMVLKTIKSMTEENLDEIELVELSNNWEEDRDFFLNLYSYTIDKDQEFEDLISKRTKNWDIERIAIVDKIIIKMALGEMIKFPSIPVKVTINEYIEISKGYSTPKSRQFVNGLLDVLATELQSEGIIRKSGRGLIDNK
jgi:transcription antitermination protein NusB